MTENAVANRSELLNPTDWATVRLESHNNLRRKTVQHIKDKSTDMASGPMQIELGTYTDPVRHAKERQVLFQQRPVLAAMTNDMPNPGDVFMFDLVGPPILLVRNKAGQVNAFLNMCTHRSAKLVTENKKKNLMTCKFHGWTFDLNGKLVGVPGSEGFNGLDMSERNLIPVPVSEWHGMIFVRATPHGEPVDVVAHLGEAFARELASLELEKAVPMKTTTWGVNSNWKYAFDTYGEGYHFATLHPSTIGALAFSNTMSYSNEGFGANHRLGMPRAEFLDCVDKPESEWPVTSYGGLYCIFPNVVINCNSLPNGRQFYGVSKVFPNEQVDQATTVITTYKPASMADFEDNQPWVEMHDFIYKVVSTEDYSVSEEGQRNMRFAPPSFKPVLGANEIAVQNIHQSINRLLAAA